MILWMIGLSILLNSSYLHANSQQADSLVKLALVSPPDTIKVKQLVEASKLYANYDLYQSISVAEQAVEMATKLGYPNVKAYALFQLGNAFMAQGILTKAIETYYLTLEILKAEQNTKVMAYLYSNLGAIKLYLKDYPSAKKEFLKVLNIYNMIDPHHLDLDIKQRLPVTLNNLGYVYQDLHQADSAAYYYRLGIQLTEKPPSDQLIRSKLLNNMASLYLDWSLPDSAFRPINEALELQIKASNMEGIAASYNLLSLYYKDKKQMRKAITFSNEGLLIAHQLGSITLIAQLTENIYHYYKDLGQSDSALKYHVIFKQFSDSLNREETLKELTRIELTSQFKAQQLIRQNAHEKRESRLYLFLGILGLLVFTLILLFLLTQSRLGRLRLQKTNADLQMQNTQLEKVNLENKLELRNKELTTNVMYLIRKNELIGQIAADLLQNKQLFKKENQQLIHRIIRDLEKAQDEAIWNDFEIRFQQVHNFFYQTLQNIAPDLTTNERRLCAFLRLQMSTKEIATITGQSPRSIEVARTRLRKKLNLTNTDTSLIDFLMSI